MLPPRRCRYAAASTRAMSRGAAHAAYASGAARDIAAIRYCREAPPIAICWRGAATRHASTPNHTRMMRGDGPPLRLMPAHAADYFLSFDDIAADNYFFMSLFATLPPPLFSLSADFDTPCERAVLWRRSAPRKRHKASVTLFVDDVARPL